MKFKTLFATAAGAYMILNVLFRIPSIIDSYNPLTLKKVKHCDSQVEMGSYNQLLPLIGREFVFEKKQNGEYCLRIASNNSIYVICNDNGEITSTGPEFESELLMEEGRKIGRKEGLLSKI